MNLIDIHTHSAASGHATHNTLTDMAKSAADRGLEILGVSEHGPATAGSCKASYFLNLKIAPKQRFGVRMLYGAEVNLLDMKGTLDLPDRILSGLDYAIASMHVQNILPGSRHENTECLIQAMKNPFIRMIGHCDDNRYPLDYEAVIQAAHDSHVLLEINNASLAPDGCRGDTIENDYEILKYCQKYGQPVILSSDSHGAALIGEVGYAKELIHQSGFPEPLVLNNFPRRLKDYFDIP